MFEFILKQLKSKKGFTLVELVVVIAILGILAAIAVPRFTGLTNNTKVKADLATARVIESAVRLHQANTGVLPGADSTNTVPKFIKDYLDDEDPKLQGDYSSEVTIDGVTIPAESNGYYMDSNGKVTINKTGTQIKK